MRKNYKVTFRNRLNEVVTIEVRAESKNAALAQLVLDNADTIVIVAS